MDILIIPGGLGARKYEIKNEIVIKWIRQQMKEVKLMTSVCTGALLLAKAGLLEGLKANQHIGLVLKSLKMSFKMLKL